MRALLMPVKVRHVRRSLYLIAGDITEISELGVRAFASKLQDSRWHRERHARINIREVKELLVTPDVAVYAMDIQEQGVGNELLGGVRPVADSSSELVTQGEEADGRVVEGIGK